MEREIINIKSFESPPLYTAGDAECLRALGFNESEINDYFNESPFILIRSDLQ